MKVVGCGCRACRRGLHQSKWVKTKVRRQVKGARSQSKVDLKAGREPKTKVPIGYTD